MLVKGNLFEIVDGTRGWRVKPSVKTRLLLKYALMGTHECLSNLQISILFSFILLRSPTFGYTKTNTKFIYIDHNKV